jgi:hypothetical protein
MDNIIEPNATFDFTKLSLAHPVGIQGGAYFTKIEYNSKPLYIQTIKSQTRQGFVKTGKKYYCDLMFDKNAETLINWFENLEEMCRKLIFEKRESWFQNNLEESDIETAFNSTIRVYKSGKYYLVRTNIKNNHNNLPAVKIYNENEISLTIEDVNTETNIISILEVQGIKFTSRNFQIEIELKQVMVLDNEPIFESCLIKTNKIKLPVSNFSQKDTNHLEDIKIKNTTIDDVKNLEEKIPLDAVDAVDALDAFDAVDTFDAVDAFDAVDTFDTSDIKNASTFDMSDKIETISSPDVKPNNLEELNEPSVPEILQKEENISLDIEDLNKDKDIEENKYNLEELDKLELNLETTLETIKLKKPNQVYFELYKEARNKAKLAKKNALLAYLEAKNIKNAYMLEISNSSDSDIDAEIEEVSESELDGL